MSTAERLENYEAALVVWQSRLTDPLNPGLFLKPAEPLPENYGISERIELWAAMKIRSRYVPPSKK